MKNKRKVRKEIVEVAKCYEDKIEKIILVDRNEKMVQAFSKFI